MLNQHILCECTSSTVKLWTDVNDLPPPHAIEYVNKSSLKVAAQKHLQWGIMKCSLSYCTPLFALSKGNLLS